MTKYGRRIAALGAFFVLCGLTAACGSGVPGNSVADVNGNPIATQAFNHWMYVAAKSQAAQSPGSPVIVANDPPLFNNCIAEVRADVSSLAKAATKTLRTDCKQLFTSLSSQVMDFLIKGYWYQAEALRQHINVTNAQVSRAFETAKKQQFTTAAEFNSFLSSTGQTLQDILFRFRISQIYSKLLAKYTPKVTSATISAYYNAHQSQFGTPETRNMRIVLAKTLSEANAAKAALSHGQSWAAVAKKYSTDPASKNNGGQLTNITKGEEDQALSNAAFSAPVNKLLGPVKGQFGYYIFEVTKITSSTQQTLAQATALIRQTLVGQQQTAAESKVTGVVTKHWKSGTTCRSVYAMTDCSGYKAPKSSTATTTTG